MYNRRTGRSLTAISANPYIALLAMIALFGISFAATAQFNYGCERSTAGECNPALEIHYCGICGQTAPNCCMDAINAPRIKVANTTSFIYGRYFATAWPSCRGSAIEIARCEIDWNDQPLNSGGYPTYSSVTFYNRPSGGDGYGGDCCDGYSGLNHVYERSGTYFVTIKAYSTSNKLISNATMVLAVPPSGYQPSASLSASPASGNFPLTVRFQGSCTDPEGNLWKERPCWIDYGDGTAEDFTAAVGKHGTITHIYTRAGNYDATLTAYDNGLKTGTKGFARVSVSAPVIPTPPTTKVSARTDTNMIYTFGSQVTANYINIQLSCIDGTSPCRFTFYCLDTTNTCTPTTLGMSAHSWEILRKQYGDYFLSATIYTPGVSYLRFKSIDSLGSAEPVQSKMINLYTPPTCTNSCPSDNTRNPYPDCSCYTPTCPTACPVDKMQNAYPDCGCVTPACPNACPSGQVQAPYPGCGCTTPTCSNDCPSGYTQRQYPDCGCAVVECAQSCPSGYAQQQYPECGCVSPPFSFAYGATDKDAAYTFGTPVDSSYVNVSLYCNSGGGSPCDTTMYCVDSSDSCVPDTRFVSAFGVTTKGVSYVRFRSNNTAGSIEQIISSMINIRARLACPNDCGQNRVQKAYPDCGCAGKPANFTGYCLEKCATKGYPADICQILCTYEGDRFQRPCLDACVKAGGDGLRCGIGCLLVQDKRDESSDCFTDCVKASSADVCGDSCGITSYIDAIGEQINITGVNLTDISLRCKTACGADQRQNPFPDCGCVSLACDPSCAANEMQLPYPGCDCVPGVCSNSCIPEQSQKGYPDCSCVASPQAILAGGYVTTFKEPSEYSGLTEGNTALALLDIFCASDRRGEGAALSACLIDYGDGTSKLLAKTGRNYSEAAHTHGYPSSLRVSKDYTARLISNNTLGYSSIATLVVKIPSAGQPPACRPNGYSECGSNPECCSGNCKGNTCSQCTADSQCDEGLICSGSPGFACVEPDCTQPGFGCKKGACDPSERKCRTLERCGPADTCKKGFMCDPETGACSADPCALVSCPSNQSCSKGRCVERCADVICPSGQSCGDGRCIDLCADAACPEGDACFGGECGPAGLCDGVECEGAQSCVFGECIDLCADAVCPAGQACSRGKCVTMDLCEGVRCGEGKACSQGQCVDPCSVAVCPSGQVCSEGRCGDPCAGVTCEAGYSCVGEAFVTVDTNLTIMSETRTIEKTDDGTRISFERVLSNELVRASPTIDVIVDTRIHDISFTAKNELSNAKLRMNRVAERPEGLSEPPGKAVGYMEIGSEGFGDADIEGAVISFKVLVSDLKGENPRSVVLRRFADGRWNDLKTKYTGLDVFGAPAPGGCVPDLNSYYNYEAETPGFSSFAITIDEMTCEGVICPAGQACAAGTCADLCAGISCPTGQGCADGQCVDPCAGVSCAAGYGCSDGVCVDPCAGVTCPGTTVCIGGSCVGANPPRPDTGPSGGGSSRGGTSTTTTAPPVIVRETERETAPGVSSILSIFGISKLKAELTTKCIRGARCAAPSDCCGAECVYGACACSVNSCATSGECCNGYCDNGVCRGPPESNPFLFDALGRGQDACAGLIEECNPTETQCVSFCNGLTLLMSLLSVGFGAFVWVRYRHPVPGLGVTFIPIAIGLMTYPFVGMLLTLVTFGALLTRVEANMDQ